MKLLNAQTLEFEEFLQNDSRPHYAILSHTWEEEEVIYHDMLNGKGRKKEGYAKIQGCCTQALQDGHHWVWVDTCCIDKSSSAELTQAINSMFEWYAKAKICYAYLADVAGHEDPLYDNIDFQKSKWFTRGWTLQELLAPHKLIFFASDWGFITTRSHSVEAISNITKIDYGALYYFYPPIDEYSIAQKMSWASKRVTTREEDLAYCLLGIFNVNMPLLYGEGGEKAFHRLQEEIIKNSYDQSIFAWPDDGCNSQLVRLNLRGDLLSPLAPLPSYFENCGSIVPIGSWITQEPYFVINSGLRFAGPISSSFNFQNIPRNPAKHEPDHLLILRCCIRDTATVIGIPLKKTDSSGDLFARVGLKHLKICVDTGGLDGFVSKSLLLMDQPWKPILSENSVQGKTAALRLKVFASPGRSIRIRRVFPPEQCQGWGGQEEIFIYPPNFDSVRIELNYWSWRAAILLEGGFKQRTVTIALLVGYGMFKSDWNYDVNSHYFNWSSSASVAFDQLEEFWRSPDFEYKNQSLCHPTSFRFDQHFQLAMAEEDLGSPKDFTLSVVDGSNVRR